MLNQNLGTMVFWVYILALLLPASYCIAVKQKFPMIYLLTNATAAILAKTVRSFPYPTTISLTSK